MTRDEHLRWAKDRALEYVNSGDLKNAFASFGSDLSKHPDLQDSVVVFRELGMSLFISGHLSTAKQMTDWIEGFN